MSTNVIAATPRKEKNKLGSLVKAFRKYYVPFVISIVLLIASVVFTILTPGMIRNLTNEISPFGKELVEGRFYVNFEAVTRYGIILVVYIAISFTTGFASGFILNTIIQKFSKDLRRGICEKINKMPLDYFDTTQTGDILSVMTNDVDTLSTSLQNSVSMLVQSAVMLIGVLIAMFIAAWQMALVVICSLPIMLIIILLTFKKSLPLFDETQNVLGEVNAAVEENYSGQLVIKHRRPHRTRHVLRLLFDLCGRSRRRRLALCQPLHLRHRHHHRLHHLRLLVPRAPCPDRPGLFHHSAWHRCLQQGLRLPREARTRR